MPPTTFAYFGINSSTLNLVIDLLIVFAVVVYLALIYWTWADARRRIADPMLVACATAAAIFPFVGPIVYTMLRPPEYLEDVRERELEMQAAEARLAQLDWSLCPHCDYRIEREFVRCPSCLAKLKERCLGCSRPLDPEWTICPYCEAEAPAAPEPPSRVRRRRSRDRERERERAALEQAHELDGEGAGALDPGELFGQTVEADALELADQDDGSEKVAPVPASNRGSRPRGSRRSSRPRPDAG